MLVDFPVGLFGFVFDRVYELIVESICFLLGCDCWCVVEGNDGIWLRRRIFVV